MTDIQYEAKEVVDNREALGNGVKPGFHASWGRWWVWKRSWVVSGTRGTGKLTLEPSTKIRKKINVVISFIIYYISKKKERKKKIATKYKQIVGI